MLEQLAFDLERPDAVARRLDDVVVSTDVPEVAVLVDPCGVARVVPAVVNRVRRLFGVAVVFHHDARRTRFHTDADLACLAGIAARAVIALNLDVVERHRLAHRAGTGRRMLEVGDGKRRLGLTEALVDRKPRVLFPEVEQVGVERLARGRRILKRREIIGVEVLRHHETIHCRRAAQSRDLVLRDKRKNLARIETIEIVRENASFHKPLPVVLAPHGLAPARVSDGEVNAVGLHVVPVLGGDEVRDGITGVVKHHLWVTGRAGRKVHEHGFGSYRVTTLKDLARRADAAVEVDPTLALDGCRTNALFAGKRRTDRARNSDEVTLIVVFRRAAARAVHENARSDRGAFIDDVVRDLGDFPDRGADDGGDRGTVQAILQIVLLQHEGSGDHDRADLCQRRRDEPELIVAAQHDEDVITALDALIDQEVRRLVGPALHVGEREDVLLAFGIAPDHRTAIRVIYRDVVDDVVAEVEVVGIVNAERFELSIGSVGLVNVAQIDIPHGIKEPLSVQAGQFAREVS